MTAPKKRLISTFVVTLVHDQAIPDLTDLVAGRVFSMDHVTDSTATHLGTVAQIGEKTIQVPQRTAR